MTRSIDDTIAAIATPPGQGGIAIVRVSGPASQYIADSLLTDSSGDKISLTPRRATLCRAIAPDQRIIDEVLAIFMPGPASHTREDVLEIHTHGGRVAANLVLDSAIQSGARMAEPGEFTLRAFLRGRIDLIQAEAVADTITAISADAHRVHEALLGGALSQVVANWQERLGAVLAQIEPHLDFPEDDLDPPDFASHARELNLIAGEMESRLVSFSWGRVAREGFRVAILGAPNVGKSSLLNRLAGEERAIVSPWAGTTRDTIEIAINAFGAPIRIIDTAGLRASTDQVEGEGINRARRAGDEADLIIVLFDGSKAPGSEELAEASALVSSGRPIIIVANKSDLCGEAVASEIGGIGPKVYTVSAKYGEGTDELLMALRDAAFSGLGADGEAALTRERHRNAVKAAHTSISTACALLSESSQLDAAASSLHAARAELRGLLGWGTPEDVLDRIFSEFCIGK